MSYKQHLRREIAIGLDETYVVEDWADDHPGHAYYDVHLDTIRRHEMAPAFLRRWLEGRGARILESGCGTGRWMAYFETLGNRVVGLDDSPGPLGVARRHAPTMPLVRGNALASPFADESFDAVLSSYVAEHFDGGPEPLLRELRRVLKPGGLLFVVVPYNNLLRRLVVHPTQRLLCAVWRRLGRPLGFTEYRYSRTEMQGFLDRSGFEVLEVHPDDYHHPWSKGLFVDVCDIGSFFNYEPKPPYEFGRFGRLVARVIRVASPWWWCGGVFYVARRIDDGQGNASPT